MSVLDPIRELARPRVKLPDTVPPAIDAKLRRGRVARDKDANKRKVYWKFWEGDHYWFITAQGNLSYQTAGMTGVVSGNKTSHRIRNTYNYVQAMVEAKTSAATGQIPGYEVTPSTDDPEDEAAASLAGQVAIYGYDKWKVRRHTTKAVTSALVAREGFVMPYFDQSIGPFEEFDDGTVIGKGEIRLLNFSRDEVMWEPEEDFDDSRWHALERSQQVREVKGWPGYVPGSIADKSESGGERESITVTEYLERPSKEAPKGRRMFFADGKPIVDHRRDPQAEEDWQDWWEPFPNMDATGYVCDEPVLHRISYTVNPQGDDLGLVERIVDCQRTINDCNNKLLEIKNRALMLRMIAPKGSNVQRQDDTPGTVSYYSGTTGKPDWEPAPDPQLVAQLVEIKREMVQELRTLSADVDVQPTARLAEGTAQLAQSSSDARWQSFLGDLAEFHSRLMRHCLTLVARYYDEERQIDIRGQYGWQPVAAFKGQDMRSQVNVRVLPGSLATKSRQAIQSEIQFIQANWPGAVSAEAALGVLHGGSAEGLIRSYENQVARAWRIVRRLQSGPDALESFGTRFDATVPNFSVPAQIDPMTGMPTPVMGADVPNWMPAPWDNIPIWRKVIGDYMCTEDFERRGEEVRHNFELIWDGLEQAEQMRAAKQAAQQQMQAQSLGTANAAKDPLPPPLPDRAGFNPGENSSAVPEPG